MHLFVFLVLFNHPFFFISTFLLSFQKWVCFDKKRNVNESIVSSKLSLDKKEDNFMAI